MSCWRFWMLSICVQHLGSIFSSWRSFYYAAGTDVRDERVTVDIYGESLCSDTTRFIRTQLRPLWTDAAIRNISKITFYPFGKAECHKIAADDYSCACQHGPEECFMNQLMSCVTNRLKCPDLYMPVLMCLQGRRHQRAAACFEDTDFKFVRFEKCANSAEGRRLLNMAGLATPALTYVPWIVVNGIHYTEAETALRDVVCHEYKGTKPRSCYQF